MMDDFLWDCALENQGKDRQWIIPDREDLFPYNKSKSGATSFTFSTKLEKQQLCQKLTEEENCIPVNIIEEKGQGVMDLIGGEVWEAALLLCSYILCNQRTIIHSACNILELGAGVGLPSFLLTKLITQSSHSHLFNAKSITITDNDDVLLDNLRSTIQQYYDRDFSLLQSYQNNEPCPIDSINIANKDSAEALLLNVCQLDWGLFEDHPSHDNNSDSNSEDENSLLHSQPISTSSNRYARKRESIEDHLSPMLYQDHYDLLIGSALCYAPYHACLADLLQYYLQGKCKEVIICQIRDREGFQAFQLRLIALNIPFQLEEISDEIYAFAQQISRSRGEMLFECSDSATKQSIRYAFPLLAEEDSEKNNAELMSSLVPNNNNNQLLKTNKESFVILRIINNNCNNHQ